MLCLPKRDRRPLFRQLSFTRQTRLEMTFFVCCSSLWKWTCSARPFAIYSWFFFFFGGRVRVVVKLRFSPGMKTCWPVAVGCKSFMLPRWMAEPCRRMDALWAWSFLHTGAPDMAVLRSDYKTISPGITGWINLYAYSWKVFVLKCGQIRPAVAGCASLLKWRWWVGVRWGEGGGVVLGMEPRFVCSVSTRFKSLLLE